MENQSSDPRPNVSLLRVESSDVLNELFGALSKAQAKMKPAVLDMVNPHYKSKYASLTSVWESIRGPISENGLCLTQQIFSAGEHYYIRSVLGHASGQWTSNTFKLLVGRVDMQGLGSAITYAKRYGLCALVGVVDTEDDDGNASLPQNPQKKTDHKKEIPNHAPVSNQKPPGPQESMQTPGEDVEFTYDPNGNPLQNIIALQKHFGIAPKDITQTIIKELGKEKLKDCTDIEQRMIFEKLRKRCM